MKINNTLNLTLSSALNKLTGIKQDIIDSLYEESRAKVDVNFRRFSKNNLTLGLCKDGINEKHPKIIINVAGLYDEKNNINDNTFVSTVVTMFHEARHMDNHLKQYTFTRDDPEECRQMALSYLVHQGSDIFYYSNYHNDPMEIDAEEYGVLMAYEYLSTIFPDVDCEKLIVDYVSSRASSSEIYFFTIFDNEEPTTIKDIQKMFDNAFAESKNKAKTYCVMKNKDMRNLRCLLDKKLIKDECWLTREHIEGTKNHEANKMIASLILHHYPEYLKKLPSLRSINFTPEHYFDREMLPDVLMKPSKIQQLKTTVHQVFKKDDDELEL